MRRLWAVFIGFVLLLSPGLAQTSNHLSAYVNGSVTATPVLVVTEAYARLYQYNLGNPNGNTGPVYVQFFDAASASSVTLGVTVPTFVLQIPPNGVTDGPFPFPYVFTNGVVIADTTTPTGSGAPTNACAVSLFYQ